MNEIFDFIDYLNNRLYIKFCRNDERCGGTFQSANKLSLDFMSCSHDIDTIPNKYIYMFINNNICGDDVIIVNYTDFNRLDEIMDIYPHVFNSRTLQMKFVD